MPFFAKPIVRLAILFAVAFVSSSIVLKPILKVAKMKGLVDNPEARKLQKIPVPVIGGLAVFFGVVVALCCFKTMIAYTALFPVLGAMTIMLYIGTLDDILDIRPWIRILLELLTAGFVTYGTRCCIIDMQGAFGIGHFPVGLAIPLTLVAFVGIVNAINMIDGIDGLGSGFCMMILAIFGAVFYLAHDYSTAVLAVSTVGALLPFFIHNVFGRESKIFIGDGGSMMCGTVIAFMVIRLLCGKLELQGYQPALDFSLAAFCVAVMAIPVTDTLRVMTWRIAHGVSPFTADNNHLHHIFLRAGYSHFSTTMLMLTLNLLVLAILAASWLAGASVTVQLIVAAAAGVTADVGAAELMKRVHARPQHEREGFWLKLQKFVDGH